MTDDHARLIERIGQARAAWLTDAQRDAAARATPESRMQITLQPGRRVIDPITGQEGTVVGGTRKIVNLQAAGRQNG